ncbi:MAG: helix-turn-helix domain-containing protein [Bacteroidales bacterium]|nr:helix-turn-helix domain-containing protein [Bacteroidales bacterium]
MDKTKDRIAAELKAYINSHTHTQKEAADRCGISAPHFANLLNGKETIGYSAARKICTAFPGLDYNYLLTGLGSLELPAGTKQIVSGYIPDESNEGALSVFSSLQAENEALRKDLARKSQENDRLLGIIEKLTEK